MLPYMPWKGVIAGGIQKRANAITLKGHQSMHPVTHPSLTR